MASFIAKYGPSAVWWWLAYECVMWYIYAPTIVSVYSDLFKGL